LKPGKAGSEGQMGIFYESPGTINKLISTVIRSDYETIFDFDFDFDFISYYYCRTGIGR
jgi:hypothetical protein